MRVRYAIIAALALILTAGLSQASTTGYVANLSGTNEVPANASPATGIAFLVYDNVANTPTTNVSFSGLTAPLTATHIHGPAAVGVNAGVIHFLATTSPPLGLVSGSYNDTWSGLTATQQGWLTGGLLYVNLHTGNFPGGEIRGQILPDATPTANVSWGRIKSLYR